MFCSTSMSLCQAVSRFFLFVHHSSVSGRTPVSLAWSLLLISLLSIHHHHCLGFSSQWEQFSGRPVWFPPTDIHTHSFLTKPCPKMEKTQGLSLLAFYLFISFCPTIKWLLSSGWKSAQ